MVERQPALRMNPISLEYLILNHFREAYSPRNGGGGKSKVLLRDIRE